VSEQETVLQAPSATEPRSRRVLVLAVLGALVVSVAAWVVLSVTGGDEPAFSVPVHDAPAPSAGAGFETATSVGAAPVVTYDVYLSRDPFDPVVPEPEPVEVIDTVATDPLTDPGQPLLVDDAGTSPVTPTEDRCSGTQEVVCDGQVVSLLDIRSGDDGLLVAVVQVDTTVHELRKGDPFAERYVLLQVTASTATIAYVDEAFTLMIGDRVLK
jgi:carbamate kinase